jgi:pimeloyl-ACP methyl ester carboxylesterase
MTATTTVLRTPLRRRVKVVEQGTGTPVVFLHSGVGSAGEFKQVFSHWPEGYRLVAIEAYRGGTGPGTTGCRSLDDYADQVYAVAEHVGGPVCLVGFSWGGATALRVAAAAPELVNSLAVIEPEAYALLRTQNADAYGQICGLRDRGAPTFMRAGGTRPSRSSSTSTTDPARSLAGRPRAARPSSWSTRHGETYGTCCSTTTCLQSSHLPG